MGSWRTLWAPHLFDFSISGWLLIGVYALALVVCADRVRREAYAIRFWSIATTAIAFFFANRLFNLTDLITLAGRCDAFIGDWYDARSPFQFALVGAIGLLGMAAIAFAYFARKRTDERVAAVAITTLLFFNLVRAVSFHDLDSALGAKLIAGHLNGAVEAALLFVVIFTALFVRKN